MGSAAGSGIKHNLLEPLAKLLQIASSVIPAKAGIK
jgi:hypothetical protein